jgi:hypothetical protein
LIQEWETSNQKIYGYYHFGVHSLLDKSLEHGFHRDDITDVLWRTYILIIARKRAVE